MMKRFAILVFCLLAGTQAQAARQSVDQTRAASPSGFVHINVVRGDLTVSGWDRDEIRVTGELDEEAEAFVFDVRDNDARIEVRIPRSHHSWWGGSEGSDLSIRVPRRSNVDISVVSTDVDADNVEGGLEIGGVSGDLYVGRVLERIDLRTVSGDIELRDATGRIRVKTVSGDIESYDTEGESSIYHTVSGEVLVSSGGQDLELETVSGDIEVVDTDFISVLGHTVSGDVEIDGALLVGGVVEFDSISGTFRLGVGGEPDARFDLETSSGSIRNRLTSDRPKKSEYVRNRNLRFVMGEGKGEVIVTTRSGDIILGR